MTLKELRNRAKELGLHGFWQMKKEELEEFVQVAEMQVKELDKKILSKLFLVILKLLNIQMMRNGQK